MEVTCHEVIIAPYDIRSGHEKSFRPYTRTKRANDIITFKFLDQFHNILYIIASKLLILALDNSVVFYCKEWNKRCFFIYFYQLSFFAKLRDKNDGVMMCLI